MTRESCAGPEQNLQMVKASGPRTALHYLAGDDEDEHVSGGLSHLVSRNWTRKKFAIVVYSGAAGNVKPRGMFSTEETEVSKNREGFKGPGGEHIKNHGQQVMSVSTPRELYARARG